MAELKSVAAVQEVLELITIKKHYTWTQYPSGWKKIQESVLSMINDDLADQV